jgi:hypothetical protein
MKHALGTDFHGAWLQVDQLVPSAGNQNRHVCSILVISKLLEMLKAAWPDPVLVGRLRVREMCVQKC